MAISALNDPTASRECVAAWCKSHLGHVAELRAAGRGAGERDTSARQLAGWSAVRPSVPTICVIESSATGIIVPGDLTSTNIVPGPVSADRLVATTDRDQLVWNGQSISIFDKHQIK